MMTCAQCGQEIVGAITMGEPVEYGLMLSTVPEVIEAHNSLCAIVYGEPSTTVEGSTT